MPLKQYRFPDAETDLKQSVEMLDTPQTRSPAYRLAYADDDFLCRDELRATRIQLERMKPELAMLERGITSTVVMFGSARIPEPSKKAKAKTEALAELSNYYDEAREFARLVTERSMRSYGRENVIVTGGGPGIMEAGNRGAADAGGSSMSLNIVLPHEQVPNRYCSPDLCFNFHYFATRKFHFLLRAKAIVVFPGGYGTLDELFETLTLIQTNRMKRMPILLFGEAFWRKIVNWEALVEIGTVSEQDIELFNFVETADEGFKILTDWDAANGIGAGPR